MAFLIGTGDGSMMHVRFGSFVVLQPHPRACGIVRRAMRGVRARRGLGFTLIELLVVLSIVALLLTIVTPRYMGSIDHAKEVALKENLKVMRLSIDRFHGDKGRYPESLEQLVEKKYLKAIPMDPIKRHLLQGVVSDAKTKAPLEGVTVRLVGQKDFRMMRFERNEVRVPDRERDESRDELSADSTFKLLGSRSPLAQSELHWRLAMPVFVIALTLFALPLARSEPRQPQYGLVLFALLVYLVGMLLLLLGTGLIGNGSMPAWLGLWWVHLPLLALSAWLFSRDGRISRPAQASRA